MRAVQTRLLFAGRGRSAKLGEVAPEDEGAQDVMEECAGEGERQKEREKQREVDREQRRERGQGGKGTGGGRQR